METHGYVSIERSLFVHRSFPPDRALSRSRDATRNVLIDIVEGYSRRLTITLINTFLLIYTVPLFRCVNGNSWTYQSLFTFQSRCSIPAFHGRKVDRSVYTAPINSDRSIPKRSRGLSFFPSKFSLSPIAITNSGSKGARQNCDR